MFHLDRAIDSWLAEAVPASCRRHEHADELEDHLRAEVDRLRGGGAGEEAAFHAATARLGNAAALARELRRSRGLLARFHAVESPREETTMTDRRLQIRVAALVLVQSLVWVVIMQVTARALSGTGQYDQVSNWLLAGWWVTTMMPLALLDLRSSARAEWQCLQRKLRVLRSGQSG